MPVRRASRQPRDFEPKNHADLPHPDRGDQLLEADPVAVGAGLTEVAVDDDHALQGPAECDRTLSQGVLTFGAFGVLEDLAERALSHVQVGLAGEVSGGHLVVARRVHVAQRP